MDIKVVSIGRVNVANNLPLVVIAGPVPNGITPTCLEMAEKIDAICSKLSIGYIYKASFDKANRHFFAG